MSIWRIQAKKALLQSCAQSISPKVICNYSKDHNPPPKCGGGKKKKKVTTDGCPRLDCDDYVEPKLQDSSTFQFHHLVKVPPWCCLDPCPDMEFPRFDECLYKESDKAKRQYQVTWVECPPIKIKPKKICCFDQAVKPPIVRRKPKEKPDTACEVEKCPPEVSGKCPKLTLPGCRPVRDPVRCFKTRVPLDCTKVNAPYPAFSECTRPKMRPKRRVECDCLSAVSLCEVIREIVRQEEGGGGSSPCGKKK